MHIRDLFQLAIGKGASDLHLAVGSPPVIRVDGELVRTQFATLTPADTQALIYAILTPEQRELFTVQKELDFALSISGLTRCRVNVHQQRGSVEASFRFIFLRIRVLTELGVPAVAAELIQRPDGLILITGPTGVGKTTTLAAMVDSINTTQQKIIICIEDPIEYLHSHKQSVVKQREVGTDTVSFPEALRRALRQDPNVIVIGEMRELETIATALTAAETGHLVLATLHTPDATQSINRIIDVFPPHQQQQVRMQLAECLQGIVSQKLLPRADKQGRVLAAEVLVATPAVRNLVRKQEIEQIPSVIQTGSGVGMQTMDQSLLALVQQGKIAKEIARPHLKDPKPLERM